MNIERQITELEDIKSMAKALYTRTDIMLKKLSIDAKPRKKKSVLDDATKAKLRANLYKTINKRTAA